jgi:ferritin-like metal-binding protein YciE
LATIGSKLPQTFLEGSNRMTLFDLYVEELRNLYNAEHQIVRALPKMVKAAADRQLRADLTDRLHQTQVHLHRLENVIDRLGVGPKGCECKVVETLIAENKDVMSNESDPTVKDLVLIGALHRLEHYEMASYECLRTLATQLVYKQAADLFQTTLDEQLERNNQLKKLANTISSESGHVERGTAPQAMVGAVSTTPFDG